MTYVLVALACVVWLYTLIAIKNGGGLVSTMALMLTLAVTIVVMISALYNEDYGTLGMLIGSAAALFMVALFVNDELVS